MRLVGRSKPFLRDGRMPGILTLLQDWPGILGIVWLPVPFSSSTLLTMGCFCVYFPTPNFSTSLKCSSLHDALISVQKRYDTITEHLTVREPHSGMDGDMTITIPSIPTIPTLLLGARIPAHEPLLSAPPPLLHPPFLFVSPLSLARPSRWCWQRLSGVVAHGSTARLT